MNKMTYGQIYEEFLNNTGIERNLILDYRPLGNGIVVRLEDGSEIVYMHKQKEITRVPIYIHSTRQVAEAAWTLFKLDCDDDLWIAILHEIPNLKPFRGTSKVSVKEREIECFFNEGMLIQAGSNTLGFWVQD